MSRYKANKQDAIYFNTDPSLTDQSAADHTDINVIVTQFLRTGQVPNPAKQPIYGDFSQLPEDTRGFIELGRSLDDLKASLPDKLKDIPVQQLITMTNEQISAILAPAVPAKPEETK